MKHLFKTALVLLLVVVFSACNSGLSITKRRYTKGYYVHQNKKVDHKSKITKTSEKKAKIKEVPATETIGVARQLKPALPAAEAQLLTASAGASKKSAGTMLSDDSETIIPVEFITNPVKSFRDLKDKIAADPAKREALSLLWILIAVLLAVYIIGLLLDSFGAGWVIHILLVVILVLLILWLLRIL